MTAAVNTLKAGAVVAEATTEALADARPALARRAGEVILDVQNISLAFGGVKALSDISFDEIGRAHV